MQKRTVNISETEYESLLKKELFYDALIDGGVEEWDGYETAIVKGLR